MILALPEREVLKIEVNNRKLTLHCLMGTVWLTDGSGRDRLLSAGSSCRIDGPETVVIEALHATEVRLVEELTGHAEKPALHFALS